MVDSAFLEATPSSRHQILHADYIKSAERCLAPLLGCRSAACWWYSPPIPVERPPAHRCLKRHQSSTIRAFPGWQARGPPELVERRARRLDRPLPHAPKERQLLITPVFRSRRLEKTATPGHRISFGEAQVSGREVASPADRRKRKRGADWRPVRPLPVVGLLG